MIYNLQEYLEVKENRLFFVDVVTNTLQEYNSNISKINYHLKTIRNEEKNEHKRNQDAEVIGKKILETLQNFEEVYKNFYQIFETAYKEWSESFERCDSVSDDGTHLIQPHCSRSEAAILTGPDRDEPKIVNEVKYLNPNERAWCFKETPNVQVLLQNDLVKTEEYIDSGSDINEHREDSLSDSESENVQESSDENLNGIENSSTESESDSEEESRVLEKLCLAEQDDFDESRTSVVLDEKLKLQCVVLVERLSKQTIDSYKNGNVKHKKNKFLTDEEFERLIDIDSLDNKKRQYSESSESSDNSKSDGSSKKIHQKTKKQKLVESESDVSSIYASSSDSDIENNDEFDKNLSDESSSKDDEETAIKNQLIRSLINNDTSEESEDQSDKTDSDSEKESITKKIKKTNGLTLPSSSNDLPSKSQWLRNSLLRFTLDNTKYDINAKKKPDQSKKDRSYDSSSDSDVYCEEKPFRKKPQGSKRKIDSSTESSSRDSKKGSDSSSSSGKVQVSKKRFPRRKRMLQSSSSESSEIRVSSSNDSSSDDCQLISSNSQKSIDLTINNVDLSRPAKKYIGRKNIRKVFDDKQITASTKQAGKEEESRVSRIIERQNQIKALEYEEKNTEELVLEFDLLSKKVLVEVDKGLVKYLKPHQKDGVKFMWNSCFETLSRIQNTPGSGCILAHCMGLGKTFQIVTLVHTLLTNESTRTKTILVICPMNVILNWVDEFRIWLKRVENKTEIKIYELTKIKDLCKRISELKLWKETGGVLIISYDMFRRFMTESKMDGFQATEITNYLENPGADVVVCDEGHMLKNENTTLANVIQKLNTRRRIVLTGTPLQNNLNEYHVMVSFVKPNLLGTRIEFKNRFVNPITNGQFDNSTAEDVRLMKHRAHVLYRMLEGCVQRCDYEVLTPYLPQKQEYVFLIRLSPLQINLYNQYIDSVVGYRTKEIMTHYNEIKRLIAHPKCLVLKTTEKRKSLKENNNTTSNISGSWWCNMINDEHLNDLTVSYKMNLLFKILSKCEEVGDKLLVFSRSLDILKAIQQYLQKINRDSESTGTQFNKWEIEKDFFRLDGSVSSANRNKMCKKFNDPKNTRARLFLISTKAGALGINLTGANRVIIFDPSWNPSDDVQSIFRVYRFGQKKPCYIYRFIGAGTMEESIYNRQVTKLSLSLRVVDQQQIERHYKAHELAELYKLKVLEEERILNVPRDKLLADILTDSKQLVYDFFEHDSLLKDKEEEKLSPEERSQAWDDYNKEKERLAQENAAKLNGIVDQSRPGCSQVPQNEMTPEMDTDLLDSGPLDYSEKD